MERRVGCRVEREVTRRTIDVGRVVRAADERIGGASRDVAGDFAEVAGHVVDLVVGDSVALQTGPISPAVLQGRRPGRQEAVLIARQHRVEVVRRTEVAELGSGGVRGRARGASRVVAPRARRSGDDLACAGPVDGGADRAAHGCAGLFDLGGRHVEPGQTVWHGTSARLVERYARRSAGLVAVSIAW